jgi:hypothetical protein
MPMTESLFYITRDIERALAPIGEPERLVIITNETPFAKQAQAREERTQIVLIRESEQLSTRALLNHPQVIKTLSQSHKPRIVVFKSNEQIEKICADRSWILLNPLSAVTNQVEEKISQIEWLGPYASLLPAHHIAVMKDVKAESYPFVIQFNHSHTGSGTHVIENHNDLVKLQTRFPDRPARVMRHIDGPTFTSNAVVMDGRVIRGQISYQITGLEPFTDNQCATIGNDWGVVSKLMPDIAQNAHTAMIDNIGAHLLASGYVGAFGIDTILEQKSGILYFLEINARQPASLTHESTLQHQQNSYAPTLFDLHLAALEKKTLDSNPVLIKGGAQLIQRVTARTIKQGHVQTHDTSLSDVDVMTSPGSAPGDERLRCRSAKSFMSGHGTFTDLGLRIRNTLS